MVESVAPQTGGQIQGGAERERVQRESCLRVEPEDYGPRGYGSLITEIPEHLKGRATKARAPPRYLDCGVPESREAAVSS